MNIFEFALQMETEASEVYADLARKVVEKGPKRIFTDLASDHMDRRRSIERMRAACGKSSGLNRQNLEEGAIPWHRQPPGIAMMADVDDEEAYRLALKLEEEEFHCYEELLEHSRAKEAKRILQQITEEEGRLLDQYRELYDFINAPNQYLAWGEFSNLDEYHQFGRDVD
jgi:hypothetical protein